jgi:hypothetical protein
MMKERGGEGTLIEACGEEVLVYCSGLIVEHEFKDYFNGYFTTCLKS